MRPRRPARAAGRAALAPLALALAAAPGAAQVADATLTAAISQRFELDTNLDLDDPSPGTSYFADTRFVLGLLQETPTQTFSLGLDTGIRALWQAEEDFEFTFASPSTATAGYAQEWASGAVDGRLRYRQTRTDFTRPLVDADDPGTGIPILPDDPAQREGETTERRYDVTLGLELATDRPSSYGFGLAASGIDYADPATDRTPRDTVEGTASWGLQFNPVLGSALTGRYYYYTADNPQQTRVTESEVDASLVYTPSALLRLSAGIGYVDREQREIVAGVRQTTESDAGIALRGSVNYDFEEFVVTGSLRYADIEDGRIEGDLRVTYPLPNSRVNARIFQTYAGGDTGDETRITGASIGFLRELDAVSQLGLNFAASRRENLDDPTDPDTDRLEATATYSYDFTDRVAGTVGYRYRYRDEDGSATSNAVFVQISRAFETRP